MFGQKLQGKLHKETSHPLLLVNHILLTSFARSLDLHRDTGITLIINIWYLFVTCSEFASITFIRLIVKSKASFFIQPSFVSQNFILKEFKWHFAFGLKMKVWMAVCLGSDSKLDDLERGFSVFVSCLRGILRMWMEGRWIWNWAGPGELNQGGVRLCLSRGVHLSKIIKKRSKIEV